MPLLPFFLTALIAVTRFEGVAARYNGFRHEAIDASNKKLVKRLDPIILGTSATEQCPAPTSTRSIHSIFFPSPNAAPVEITAQSQVVTTFRPEATWCVGAPIALMPVSGPPYFNQSTEFETLAAGTGFCETAYVAEKSTVCATTLTGIASKITVTDCDQEITFSSECGFTLETPTPVATTNFSLVTPAPTVKRMKTFWVAPWQSLTLGSTPSDVDIKVCTILDDDEESMECTRYQEVWEVIVVTQTLTTESDVQLTTTVTGPGTLIVQTMEVTVTNTVETVDLSTTMLLETEIESESISKGKKVGTRPTDDISAPPATSTIYITRHVKYKSSRPEPTTTVLITSIALQTVGTITRTRSRPRPTFLELPNF